MIERWKTGYLADVESNLQRLSQIVEGPDGLEKRIAMMRGFEGNSTQSEIFSMNQVSSLRDDKPIFETLYNYNNGSTNYLQTALMVNLKIRMLLHRVRIRILINYARN